MVISPNHLFLAKTMVQWCLSSFISLFSNMEESLLFIGLISGECTRVVPVNRGLQFFITQDCVPVIHWYFQDERRTSNFLLWNYSSQKGSVHSVKFRFCFLNIALPHQLVTTQGKVLKIWIVYGHSRWFYKRFYIPTTFLFFRKC